MKQVRILINTLITTLMGFLSVSCNDPVPAYGVMAMYGVPTNLVDVEGQVTNNEGEPLQSIKIEIKTSQDGTVYHVYTNADGKYSAQNCDFFGFASDTLKVVATDTTHLHAPDSVQIPFAKLDLESDNGWTREYSAEVNVELKKDNQ